MNALRLNITTVITTFYLSLGALAQASEGAAAGQASQAASSAAVESDPTQGDAGPSDPSARKSATLDDLGLDVEVDPLAYVMAGYSAHLGVGLDRFRLDAGVFGVDLPEGLHGNPGFQVRMDGVGAKFDVFVLDPRRQGLFAGVQLDHVAADLRAPDGSRDRAQRAVLGARVGWRLAVIEGLFVSPWIAVTHTLGARDRDVGDARFVESRWGLFPTVHLGYRWR